LRVTAPESMNNPTTTIVMCFPVKPDQQTAFQIALHQLLGDLRQEETFIEAHIHRHTQWPTDRHHKHDCLASEESLVRSLAPSSSERQAPPYQRSLLARSEKLVKRSALCLRYSNHSSVASLVHSALDSSIVHLQNARRLSVVLGCQTAIDL
jgi:hypothetical protein